MRCPEWAKIRLLLPLPPRVPLHRAIKLLHNKLSTVLLLHPLKDMDILRMVNGNRRHLSK